MNGTKNNAKELGQRIQLDSVSMTVLELLRRPCIAETEITRSWLIHQLGQLTDSIKEEDSMPLSPLSGRSPTSLSISGAICWPSVS
jgi:hypothetical protein